MDQPRNDSRSYPAGDASACPTPTASPIAKPTKSKLSPDEVARLIAMGGIGLQLLVYKRLGWKP